MFQVFFVLILMITAYSSWKLMKLRGKLTFPRYSNFLRCTCIFVICLLDMVTSLPVIKCYQCKLLLIAIRIIVYHLKSFVAGFYYKHMGLMYLLLSVLIDCVALIDIFINLRIEVMTKDGNVFMQDVSLI